MVIQSNLPAVGAHRNLGMNNAMLSKSLEKLSSGYRINRAGDDAAGLAISEKMRSQIRGLEMARQNTENAVSLIQTAEGGLNETHAILQRMRELAVQSANGTYTQQDRAQITAEYKAALDEIDRISLSTQYNTMSLLDGGIQAQPFSTENLAKVFGGGGINNAAFSLLPQVADEYGLQHTHGESYSGAIVFSFVSGQVTCGVQLQGQTFMFEGNAQHLWGHEMIPDPAPLFTDAIFFWADGTFADFSQYANETVVIRFDYYWRDDGGVCYDPNIGQGGSLDRFPNATISSSVFPTTFQIGANGGADQRVDLYIQNMSTANLGGAGMVLAQTRVDSIAGANRALATIDAAVGMVSAQRAALGALQNRLEHTINSLGVSIENLTAAESTIRDADMAKEMMKFTQQSVLVQASQAILAQANGQAQGVLSLLR